MDQTIIIDSGTLSAEIVTAGAAIRALRLAGFDHSLVVGVGDLAHYETGNRDYFGATVGRFANRIGGGQLTIDGALHQLACNDPPNHLHGGPDGFSTRLWSVEARHRDRVTLSYVSEDGEAGYPGRLSCRATFFVSPEGELSITYEAETDRATVVNLSSHLYFNLDGSEDVGDHLLQVFADDYLPIDEGTLPDGRILTVEGGGFDFRAPRKLRDAPALLDHNYCLAGDRSATLRPAAILTGPETGLSMTLQTSEPGLQVYDGSKLDGSFADLAGRPIRARAAAALEPQVWPDAPNRPDFPQALLRPGEHYRHFSRYRFTNPGRI
ncbi:aldose epimerase family protein [Aurantimonas sp. HBX-1]|uniref:aldose epimerase family protein n=1 Tax=Aurantimonas sp. HBX-1 TaxID=2906072 RepID=UPI001F28425F|nr:aldose epimerase family protein [Aurantimonas sp. HBX-1]UIJ71484.1 galactose mutarotase [Aurantimonas sp. HBX-1]